MSKGQDQILLDVLTGCGVVLTPAIVKAFKGNANTATIAMLFLKRGSLLPDNTPFEYSREALLFESGLEPELADKAVSVLEAGLIIERHNEEFTVDREYITELIRAKGDEILLRGKLSDKLRRQKSKLIRASERTIINKKDSLELFNIKEEEDYKLKDYNIAVKSENPTILANNKKRLKSDESSEKNPYKYLFERVRTAINLPIEMITERLASDIGKCVNSLQKLHNPRSESPLTTEQLGLAIIGFSIWRKWKVGDEYPITTNVIHQYWHSEYIPFCKKHLGGNPPSSERDLEKVKLTSR